MFQNLFMKIIMIPRGILNLVINCTSLSLSFWISSTGRLVG